MNKKSRTAYSALTHGIAAVCLGVVIAAGSAGRAFAATAEASAAFKREFGSAFLDQYWRLHPNDAIDAGYYKVAGLLTVPNEADRAARLRFLRASLAKLKNFEPAALDARGVASLLELAGEDRVLVVQRLEAARAQDRLAQPLESEDEQQPTHDEAERVQWDDRECRSERGDDDREREGGRGDADER